jgi:hypothetical protein
LSNRGLWRSGRNALCRRGSWRMARPMSVSSTIVAPTRLSRCTPSIRRRRLGAEAGRGSRRACRTRLPWGPSLVKYQDAAVFRTSDPRFGGICIVRTQCGHSADTIECSRWLLPRNGHKMASPRGLEPPTHSLGNCCSIQLSYGDAGRRYLYQRGTSGANLARSGWYPHKSLHGSSRRRHNRRHPLSQGGRKPCVV